MRLNEKPPLNAPAEGPLSGRQGCVRRERTGSNRVSPGDATTDARFQTGM
ncbi:hypothetical protein SAMN05216266_106100 [Amycolatopsis marina]|uniref:Uncharacterized protein n=1 Tax=Amycolatopsis marina TaxID=490629 RepID=A0A1I0Z818_9PSEU|nr:hypothetical protein SAMN05216266_106100 [Amycolatopsis marina]